jgi:membrane protein DedA with SNARE-associated domain
VQQYYKKYGFWTLLIGRFIPFGVRNCLFLTAGMGKMHFGKFILSDGIACLCSNLALFSLAYTLSRHYNELMELLKTFNLAIFIGFLVTGIAIFWYKKRNSNRKRIDP